MKKPMKFLLVSALSALLVLITVNFDSVMESNIVPMEDPQQTLTAKEQADEMIKKAALSVITPHLEKSLKQSMAIAQENLTGYPELPATCFAPDTNQDYIDAFYENRMAIANSFGLFSGTGTSNFNLGGRWGTTAIDGGGLGQGDVTTLTWSYVPDGTAIGNGGCGVPGESSAASDFIAFFNGIYGGPTVPNDYTTAPWHSIFVDMFDSWSSLSGLIFVYEPIDDGATVVTGGVGITGTRGDFRISGHSIDGNSGVLACNYFPENGDMIIDTADNFYLNNPNLGTSNVLTHEIGHGLGIQHVCPVEETKLMEPFVSFAFDGPQEDDILATNRHYGDTNGSNDTSGTAVFLGNDSNPAMYARTQRSIDDNSDVDYFSFTINQSSLLSGALTPTGTTYLDGVQLSGGACSAGSNFNALTVSDLMIEVIDTDGTTVIATADANGAGGVENLAGVNLVNVGTYFVRVSQQGSAVNNVQMYDFDISLTAAVITPEISFATITGNAVENTDCASTDYAVNLNIGAAPSVAAEVTFSIDGASTAVQGLDFDLQTSSVIFPTSGNAPQELVLRVYHDAFVEGDDTIIVNTTLNANGGNATLNASLDTHTFTITNDDAAPVGSTTTTVLFEDFEDATGWGAIDADGDGFNWGIFPDQGWSPHQYAGQWAGSQSWDGTEGALTPNNYIFSPQFTIPANASGSMVSYIIGSADNASFFAEHYSVYFTTDISSDTAILANAITLENDRTIPANGTELRSHDLFAAGVSAGDTGYFVVRHHNTNDVLILGLDTVTITAEIGTAVQTAVSAGTSFDFENTGSAFAYDDTSGLIMANIVNNNTFDYGCTTVAVSRAGTGAQSYNGSSSPDFVTDKTFTITPVNTTGSGDATITFYFEEAEIAGWEAATGLARADLFAARGTATSVTESVATTVGAFGANVTLTATFTGLDGTYYFGPTDAFVPACAGVTKTWNGSNWSPAGAPGATDTVILTGNYNTTSHGDIEACKLTINSSAMLDVEAATYVRVQGDINVDDGSLIVRHEGSLVQVDDSAVVTKNATNGTINVEVTSPILRKRDFMVMGSPMDVEVRTGVWNSAFLVLDFHSDLFIPHPDVPAGGTNFADDNGNFYQTYTGGVTPGEAYVVRPQNGYNDPSVPPAGRTFDFTYELGTLNNGVVEFTNQNNGPTDNPDGTPNMIANPYASAIDADQFMTDNPGISELYYWEHLTQPGAPLPVSNLRYDMDDFSYYNGTMGIPAANDLTMSHVPNSVISTAQGFGVRTTGAAGTTGTITFNNGQRLTSGNTTLRRPQVPAETLLLEVRELTYNLGAYSGVAFKDGATSEFDPGMDSQRLATVVSLYSHLDDGSEELGIQTRGAFDASMQIPMGFATQIDETLSYKISLKDIEGVNLEEVDVFLLDHQTNIVQNLKEDSYAFTSTEGSYSNRFTLYFESLLGTDTVSLDSIAVYPNPADEVLNIVSPSTVIESVEIHDLRGRKVQEVNGITATSHSLDISELNTAMYFVTITTNQGSITKRIIKE